MILNDNAKLIDKIQSLQQEVQELRGQLEVQAHDLKLLQQQQVAFYKDLDARLGSGSAQSQPKKTCQQILALVPKHRLLNQILLRLPQLQLKQQHL